MADPNVPEAGLYDKSGVHRGSDWEPLTVVTANTGERDDLSDVDAGIYTESTGTLTAIDPVSIYTFTVTSTLGDGEFEAEVTTTSGNLGARLTLSDATGRC